jgi:hypothetical protein
LPALLFALCTGPCVRRGCAFSAPRHPSCAQRGFPGAGSTRDEPPTGQGQRLVWAMPVLWRAGSPYRVRWREQVGRDHETRTRRFAVDNRAGARGAGEGVPDTARSWIERYHLRRKVGGRWRADVEKVREAACACWNGMSRCGPASPTAGAPALRIPLSACRNEVVVPYRRLNAQLA